MTTLFNNEPWVHGALCTQVDPEMFYPNKHDRGVAYDAKRVCQQCPVIAECLEYALARNEEHGVWGGTTRKERQQIRRDRRIPVPVRTHCNKGHNLERAGVRPNGLCAECSRNFDRNRRRNGTR